MFRGIRYENSGCFSCRNVNVKHCKTTARLPAVAHEMVDDDCQLLVEQCQTYPRITRTWFATNTSRRHPSHNSKHPGCISPSVQAKAYKWHEFVLKIYMLTTFFIDNHSESATCAHTFSSIPTLNFDLLELKSFSLEVVIKVKVYQIWRPQLQSILSRVTKARYW